MKKFICLLVASMMLFSISAEDYEIETSKGTIKVVVPEGQTMEQAFLEMSKLYLEERFDHEDLLNEVKDLNTSIDKYKDSEKVLKDLNTQYINDYKVLAKLYDKKIKIKVMKPFTGLAYNLDNQVALDFGVTLFEKVQVSTIVSYPMTLGIRLGITL